MKARDLAALAALGIAGKMAYDKFGRKKDDEPKSKGKLGKAQSANDGDAGESEARMSKRDMNEGSGRRDAGGDADYQMPRTAPRTVPEDYDAPRTAPRQPVAVAKPVAEAVVEARSLDSVGGLPRYNRAADSNAAGSAYNSDIMYNNTIPYDRQTQPRENKIGNDAGEISATDAQTYARMQRQGSVIPRTMNQLAATRMQRQGTQPAQSPNAQAQARLLRQGAPATRYAKGGITSSKPSSASSRGDGIAQRGKTRGKMC